MPMTPAHLRTMRHRVSYGLPLTIDEQRLLVEQVTGEKIERLKRCETCNAESVVISETGEKKRCDACGGYGYVPSNS